MAKNHVNFHLQYLFEDLYVIYIFFYILWKFSIFPVVLVEMESIDFFSVLLCLLDSTRAVIG